MRKLMALSILLTATLALVPAFAAEKALVTCSSPECMNKVLVAESAAAAKQRDQDAVMRELCLAEGKTWREKGVTYVGLKHDQQCFTAEWHIFTHGGAQ